MVIQILTKLAFYTLPIMAIIVWLIIAAKKYGIYGYIEQNCTLILLSFFKQS